MKIAIPSETDQKLDSIRSGHFGHTPYFTVVTYDDDMNIVDAEAVKNVDHDQYGCGGVIEYVLGMDVDGILTVGMGMPPLMRFTQGGVTVYSETQTPKVGDVAKLFAEGKVQKMSPENACRH
jgi:predicted Fe-Mo cluster-binding NifX family protein